MNQTEICNSVLLHWIDRNESQCTKLFDAPDSPTTFPLEHWAHSKQRVSAFWANAEHRLNGKLWAFMNCEQMWGQREKWMHSERYANAGEAIYAESHRINSDSGNQANITNKLHICIVISQYIIHVLSDWRLSECCMKS